MYKMAKDTPTPPLDTHHFPDLHPDIAKAAARLHHAGLARPAAGDIQSVRDYLERVTQFVSATSVPLPQERLLHFPTKGRRVPCKLYWPDGHHPLGLMFYCHGGGFRHGTLAGWDAPLRQLVRESGVAVLSIEHALAPEHPFPAAFEELVALAQQVIHEGSIAEAKIDRFAFGGDSSGANLALGAAVSMLKSGVTNLGHLLLFYGVYSKDLASDSWQRLSNYAGHGLSADSMRQYWTSYLQKNEGDWRAQPLHADLAGLPATRLVVGDLDPLLDENVILHKKLMESGVESHLTVAPGVMHGVLRFNELAGVVREMIQSEAQALRRSFSR